MHERASEDSIAPIAKDLLCFGSVGPPLAGLGEPVARFGRHTEILSIVLKCVNQNHAKLFMRLRTSSGIGREAPS